MGSTRLAANIILVILAFFVTFAMFITKNTVQNMEKELKYAQSDIDKNKNAIHILKVEWSYLNRPERIRNLVAKYTSLEDIQAKQMVNYAALPFKYENTDNNRRLMAQKNINSHAEQNLKHLAKFQR